MNGLELDKQRVKILFELNSLLIYRAMVLEIAYNSNLNVNGIPISEISSTIQLLSSPTVNKVEIVQHYLKRVQVNLTCIGELNEKHRGNNNRTRPIFPQMLTPPPESTSEITSRYFLLNKLFPEALPYLQQQKALFLKQQQGQQGQQSQQQQQQSQQQPPRQPQQPQAPQPQPQSQPHIHQPLAQSQPQQIPLSNGSYPNGSINNPNIHSNSSTPLMSSMNIPPHNTLRTSNNNTTNNSPLMGGAVTMMGNSNNSTANPNANISPQGSTHSTPSSHQPFFKANTPSNTNNGNITLGNMPGGLPMRNMGMMENMPGGMVSNMGNMNMGNNNMSAMGNMNMNMVPNMQTYQNMSAMNPNNNFNGAMGVLGSAHNAANNNNNNNNGNASFPMGNMNLSNMNINQMNNPANPGNMGSAGSGMW